MQIGKKIYYDKLTGNVILITPEMQGEVRGTTIEEDFQIYKVLSERNPETVGVIQLEFGQYAQDFMICTGYHVNVETGQIEFSYPDPNQTTPQEPVYQQPLSEQMQTTAQTIAQLTLENADLKTQLQTLAQTIATMQLGGV